MIRDPTGGGTLPSRAILITNPHFTPALLFVPAPDCRLRPIGTLQRSKQQVPKDSRPLPRSDVVRPYETSRCGHRDPESWGATEDDVPAGQQQRGFGLCVGVGGGSSPGDAGRRRTGCLPLFPAAAASASARDTR
ncbi:hypothetical protein CH63R_01006 [Colletotrichum higginsianum IMI 349063]|uniref:Uncharacterized protein n=2 Tax=Colletotrichum higginsianum TaxID=80884 RepID=A0A1B7YUV0_COLHI|nr:hypothetical protein CH63R_01006 [Colletotrichum higginsianum IMI 349063]OBR15826.1 hypothetical protein CH63R_01006 [Colletotrichum higginsianum IMI 349063]TID05142.1 hypothetical protein CH35J_002415 [Colletotrichum higginsianum]